MDDTKKIIHQAQARLPDSAWNDTRKDYPDVCIHELFQAQVAKTPDAVALIDGDLRYTYAEINAKANRLAQALREHGVIRESVVACYLTRSASVIVCTLAILKAGGTYLLFDAHMPVARLEYIVVDARPMLMITDTEFTDISLGPRLNVVSLNELTSATADSPGTNLDVAINSSGAAYIAYTSGSTGEPKGVIITHRATVNHALAFSQLFELSQDDRVPLMAPIAFDMAVEEMVPPLVSGCTLIVSSSRFATMAAFQAEITKNRYTLLNLPAPLWEEWTEFLDSHGLPIPASLRLVIAGSEAINTKIYESWRRLAGARTLRWVAAYGTTETTVTSTFYTSAATDELSGEPFIPIGKPIPNVRTYILDEHLQPVNVGEVGELYIGGAGLARGYYHRDELTQRLFVHDPFNAGPDAKMYRTGDLARYRPDGVIVWLGRTDSQIKLRGLRIEPGEIEAVLNAVPFVQESAVVVQQTGERAVDKQLVAFVTVQTGQKFDPEELRQRAAAQLTSLMVPQKYVQLSSLPLNANGKLDRKALEHLLT